MHCQLIVRRGLVALVALVALSVSLSASGGAASATVEQDYYRPLITNEGIDFGDGSFIFGAPVGGGTLQLTNSNGIVTPVLLGTLHLDNVSQQWGRMHIGYFDPGGNLLEIHHGGSVKAIDNAHHKWNVILAPLPGRADLYEVEVCTELSGDNVSFDRIGCHRYHITT